MYHPRRLLVPLTYVHRHFARISHLSPLADAFNALRQSFEFSVGEQTSETSLFGNSRLTSPAGFTHLVNDATEKCTELLQEALSPHRNRKMVQVLDDMSDSLCRAADLADCIRMLHPDSRYRDAASMTCRAIGSLVEELNTIPELYAASVRSSRLDQNRLPVDQDMDQIDQRVLDLFIADFELSGVQLKDPIRQADFVRAANAALTFGSEFVQASHTSVPFRLSTPRNGREIDVRLFQPLIDDPRPDVREASYRAFYAPLPGQEERLTQLMLNRHNMARAAGFDKFADRAILHSLATSSECVDLFLEHLCRAVAPLATRTAHEHLIPVVARDRSSSFSSELRLGPWDLGYALGSKRQLVQLDELCDYFSLGACMEGVSQLADCLFGLRLRVEPVQPGETWDPTVVKVGVYGTRRVDVGPDGAEGLLGWVYCDLLDRPGKPMQDCHYTIQGGRSLEHGAYQKPIITLQLTLNSPVQPDAPLLLTPGQVENLFHEWGHAFHSMLARTRYQHVTGTRCSTDLAEVPSTLFERFALDPRVTKEYARHWRTGSAPGKQELEALQRLAVGGQLGCSLELMQQASYAQLDQILHSGPPEVTLQPQFTTGPLPASSRLLSHIQTESGLSDWLSCDARDVLAWPHRFAHLVGYGGRYYAYLMARAGAHLIWENCFARDPWSSTNGEIYANSLLRLGGEYPAAQMLSNVLATCSGAQHNDDGSCSLVESTLTADQLARSLVTQVEGDESAAADLLKRMYSPGLYQPRIPRRTI